MSRTVTFGRNVALSLSALALCLVVSSASADTIVRFDTSLGSFDVQLFESVTPITTANFLNYVGDGDYDGSFFHRLAPGFILQGGGFRHEAGTDGVQEVPADPPIQNEYWISNVRGTIAMAKLGGDPNSATSEFYFNLADNSANLNNQNGGFTVFGVVLGYGMNVVDQLASQGVWNRSALHEALTDLPLIDYSGEGDVWDDLEVIRDITVVHAVTGAVLLGDMDGNGQVGSEDVEAFVLALTNPALFATTYGLDTDLVGDMDGNGVLDGDDIRPFLSALSGEASASVTPEPATVGLLAVGAFAGLLRRRQ